jgi:hypothetical protein
MFDKVKDWAIINWLISLESGLERSNSIMGFRKENVHVRLMGKERNKTLQFNQESQSVNYILIYFLILLHHAW